MKHPSQQAISRWLVFDFVRRNWHAFAFVFFLIAAAGAWLTNDPVSTRVIEGRFVRWTLEPSKGPPNSRVYVDLADGRTTAVMAWPTWQPPAVGSVIRLNESTLRWFGSAYSLAPAQ